MKHWTNALLLLSAVVFLWGCGGGQSSGSPSSSSPPNIAGNWQFNTTPEVAGMPAITIAGSISQSGSSLSGAVHVDGSNCFDPLVTLSLTATLTGGNISLTSTPLHGQIMTVTGAFTGLSNNTFTGTYSIKGGCADGEKGSVAGINVPTIGNSLNGVFTTSGGDTFDVAVNAGQNGSSSSAGSFGISGTATFQTSCFSSGTIASGRFPSGSFILGTSVALVIETGNGTLAFLGTEDLATSEISGSYKVTGGTCDQNGTAVLVAGGQWDY